MCAYMYDTHKCAINMNIRMQEEALVNGSDVESFNDRSGTEGNTALIRAAGYGDLERLRLLLDAGYLTCARKHTRIHTHI